MSIPTPRYRIHTDECGGTVLHHGEDDREYEYDYCSECGAFFYYYAYGTDADLPTGTDPEANRAAWDAGEYASPMAEGEV